MLQDDIRRFIRYGKARFSLSEEDALFAQNAVLALLGQDALPDGPEPEVGADLGPDEAVRPLLEAALEGGTERERLPLLEAALFGCLLPRPSEVIRAFAETEAKEGIRAALDAFYRQCIDSNYIRMGDIRKNIEWTAPAPKADLVVTVNLSKPEKDNKEIARQRSLPQSSYPKCMLCAENLGYAGRLNFPARQTLRFLPLTLGGERWYFQFSPYVYYPQHCIAFSAEHRPMKIDRSTLVKLLDFVDRIPHYFIGSNADLPIVGGSILSHEHFQGGGTEMPLQKTALRRPFAVVKGARVGVADWYNSVVRVEGEAREAVLEAADAVQRAWRGYADPEVGVENSPAQPHNTVTPVACRRGKTYRLDLILRNNVTSPEFPDGVFHAHPEHHNIKKEGIGIIEAMGVFILPGRLQRQCRAVAGVLTGRPFDPQDPDLAPHRRMVEQLTARHGTALGQEEAEAVVRQFLDQTCLDILRNTAVFKEDEKGQAHFDRFLTAAFGPEKGENR